jgi:hypothetical protein
MKKYGFQFNLPTKSLRGGVEEGAPIGIQCFAPPGGYCMEVVNYYFAREAYIKELNRVGFENVEIVEELQFAPHPSGCEDFEEWDAFFACPLFFVVVATKG